MVAGLRSAPSVRGLPGKTTTLESAAGKRLPTPPSPDLQTGMGVPGSRILAVVKAGGSQEERFLPHPPLGE